MIWIALLIRWGLNVLALIVVDWMFGSVDDRALGPAPVRGGDPHDRQHDHQADPRDPHAAAHHPHLRARLLRDQRAHAGAGRVADAGLLDRRLLDLRRRDDRRVARQRHRRLGARPGSRLTGPRSPGPPSSRARRARRRRRLGRLARRARRFTVPSNGELTGISIFIASSTTSGWRARTASPGSTSTRITVPGIGAVTVLSPCDAPGAMRLDVHVGRRGRRRGRQVESPRTTKRPGGAKQRGRRERGVLGQERCRRVSRAHDRVRDQPAQERKVRRHAVDPGLGECVGKPVERRPLAWARER